MAFPDQEVATDAIVETYGDGLRALLMSRGVSVFMQSPKRVHDAREVFDGVPQLTQPISSTKPIPCAGGRWSVPRPAENEAVDTGTRNACARPAALADNV